MKRFAIRGSIFLTVALLLSLPAAQGKDGVVASRGPEVPSPGSRPTPGTAGGGAEAGGAGGASAGHVSPSGNTSVSQPAVYLPNLRGTSFQTFNSYYFWNDYFYYLSSRFDMNPLYFDRFYRNSEPLITPVMLKVTLRDPIRMSSEMLDAIDQLQEMLEKGRSATPLERQALLEKSRHIRELAKQIRRNQTVSNYDLRENKSLYKTAERHESDSRALQSLRGMATDLDRQLREMYRQSSTSTISVDSYREPSLESLAKAIEKICKDMETQSKKL